MKIIKFLCVLCIFLNTIFLFAQENKEANNKGEWIVTNQIGFTTLEAKNNFKVNATVFEGIIAKEFILNKKVSLIAGIEFLRVKADFYSVNNQLFLNNNSVNIPVALRWFYNREQQIALFIDIGIYGSYLYKSKIEDVANNTDFTEKGLGTSFGLQANIGAKYKINKKVSISFGIKSKTDLINSSKNSVQEFKLTDFYAFQLGLGFTL